MVTEVESGRVDPSEHVKQAPVFHELSIAVYIYLSHGSETIEQFLIDNGVTIRRQGYDYLEAFVPIDVLGPVSQLDGVLRVDPVHPPHTNQSDSDGTAGLNSAQWHQVGFTGKGTKVGVIDIGFEGFSALMGTELPATVTARCYHQNQPGVSSVISDCEWRTKHGSAVSEALIDVAPDVELYIANPQSKGDLSDAVDWMVSEGISVINHSVHWSWDGPGDGTWAFSNSPLHSLDRAVTAGTVWINSAGHYRQSTWMGVPTDYDGDSWIEFAANDDTNGLNWHGGEKIYTYLRWDDSWSAAATDLDLYLFHADSSLAYAVSAHQSGKSGDVPSEWLSWKASNDGQYTLRVKLHSGDMPAWLQLQSWTSHNYEHSTEASISNPGESASPGMLTVGAADWETPNEIESFSGVGPTPDGRGKPDIVGPDNGYSIAWGANSTVPARVVRMSLGLQPWCDKLFRIGPPFKSHVI